MILFYTIWYTRENLLNLYKKERGQDARCLKITPILTGALTMIWWPLPTSNLAPTLLIIFLMGYGVLGCYLFMAVAGNSQRLKRLGAKIHELQLRVRNMRRVAYGEINVDWTWHWGATTQVQCRHIGLCNRHDTRHICVPALTQTFMNINCYQYFKKKHCIVLPAPAKK